jgi:hypothetical protein
VPNEWTIKACVGKISKYSTRWLGAAETICLCIRGYWLSWENFCRFSLGFPITRLSEYQGSICDSTTESSLYHRVQRGSEHCLPSRLLFVGDRVLQGEEHSLPPGVTSSPPSVFILRCLIKMGNNFIFTFYGRPISTCSKFYTLICIIVWFHWTS